MSIPWSFRDPALLEQALTHSSYANEHGEPDNQRLEFLGDAVIELVVTEMLVSRFADWDEGRLHRARASIVRTESLAEFARGWDIGPMLRLGRGEERAGGRGVATVLEDAFEAVIAAVFLDGGLDAARSALNDLVTPRLEALEGVAPTNARNVLQERVEASGGAAPVYRVVGHSGPAHDRRWSAVVEVGGGLYGPVEGRSRRAAFVAVAELALAALYP